MHVQEYPPRSCFPSHLLWADAASAARPDSTGFGFFDHAQSATGKTARRLAGPILIALLSACGNDEAQSPAIVPTGGTAKANIVAPALTQGPSSCFENAEGFEVAEDGTLLDSAGPTLIPLPLIGKADEIAASSPDFCGKWANEDPPGSRTVRYIFKTNPDCARRALPGQFVQLGVDPEPDGNVEFMQAFVACKRMDAPPIDRTQTQTVADGSSSVAEAQAEGKEASRPTDNADQERPGDGVVIIG